MISGRIERSPSLSFQSGLSERERRAPTTRDDHDVTRPARAIASASTGSRYRLRANDASPVAMSMTASTAPRPAAEQPRAAVATGHTLSARRREVQLEPDAGCRPPCRRPSGWPCARRGTGRSRRTRPRSRGTRRAGREAGAPVAHLDADRPVAMRTSSATGCIRGGGVADRVGDQLGDEQAQRAARPSRPATAGSQRSSSCRASEGVSSAGAKVREKCAVTVTPGVASDERQQRRDAGLLDRRPGVPAGRGTTIAQPVARRAAGRPRAGPARRSSP